MEGRREGLHSYARTNKRFVTMRYEGGLYLKDCDNSWTFRGKYSEIRLAAKIKVFEENTFFGRTTPIAGSVTQQTHVQIR